MVRGKQIGIELYQELQAKLKAETTRRMQAEVVIDNCVDNPRIYASTDSGALAELYRAKYPKEKK